MIEPAPAYIPQIKETGIWYTRLTCWLGKFSSYTNTSKLSCVRCGFGSFCRSRWLPVFSDDTYRAASTVKHPTPRGRGRRRLGACLRVAFLSRSVIIRCVCVPASWHILWPRAKKRAQRERARSTISSVSSAARVVIGIHRAFLSRRQQVVNERSQSPHGRRYVPQ
jgi:hypothetical protein